ncbi:hypothetical protein [Azospirillum sp. INR13]|uniref:hypothetical protein n=1 Tax=Azospirillum sp. INR13 TaxID=2596919 RepID=UPI0021064E0A|nr:hypothetical protein [Azospirillum sp. INR13]
MMRACGKRLASAVTASISASPARTPPLQLEIVEAVAVMGGFRQADHRIGGQGHVMAQAEPVVPGIGFAAIGQGGLGPVADIEKIAQHLDRVALLALAEQGGDRNLQELAEQVEQGGFQSGDGMDGDSQVEGLQAAAAGIAVGEGLAAAFRMLLKAPTGWPTTRARASSRVWRIFSPPGTSPTPVWPALSFRMTTLRVKKGAWAPDRFSSIESWPATGTTSISVTLGEDWVAMVGTPGKGRGHRHRAPLRMIVWGGGGSGWARTGQSVLSSTRLISPTMNR